MSSNINSSSVLWHLASTIQIDLEIFEIEELKLKLLNDSTLMSYMVLLINTPTGTLTRYSLKD